jgi:hypothetical protein
MYLAEGTGRQLLLFKQATLEQHAGQLFAMLETGGGLANLDVAALRRYAMAVRRFAANLLEEVEYESAFAAAQPSPQPDAGAEAAASSGGSPGAAGGAGRP